MDTWLPETRTRINTHEKLCVRLVIYNIKQLLCLMETINNLFTSQIVKQNGLSCIKIKGHLFNAMEKITKIL
jgi:hypothetical protein